MCILLEAGERIMGVRPSWPRDENPPVKILILKDKSWRIKCNAIPASRSPLLNIHIMRYALHVKFRTQKKMRKSYLTPPSLITLSISIDIT